jgi:hypothetical protein
MYVDDMTAAFHSALKPFAELTMIIRWCGVSKASGSWVPGTQATRSRSAMKISARGEGRRGTGQSEGLPRVVGDGMASHPLFAEAVALPGASPDPTATRHSIAGQSGPDERLVSYGRTTTKSRKSPLYHSTVIGC